MVAPTKQKAKVTKPNILKPVEFEAAYLKMGIYGLTGSGKSYTAMLIAMGLWKYVCTVTKKKPKGIAYADTESGSDFLYDRFKKELNIIGLTVAKTRRFKDLGDIVDEAEKENFLLIVDSITHYWNEFLFSFLKKHDIKRIALKHWPELKQTWRSEFADKYVNSKIHMIVCGRSADIWEDIPDEEGFLELKKVGTKLKAEGELGYESNLLVEMELHRTGPKIGEKWINRAWVNKDKFDRMNFSFFDSPTFDSFLPHIERLNIGGKHRAIDTSRGDSQEIFRDSNVGYQKIRIKEQVLDCISNELYLIYPGRDEESKTSRFKLLEKILGTHSWEVIKDIKDNQKLKEGLKTLEEIRKSKEKK